MSDQPNLTAFRALMAKLRETTDENTAAGYLLAYSDEVLRNAADGIRRAGQRGGWPTWSADYIDPDVSFARPAEPAIGQPEDLRQRIADALAREDARNWGYDHGFDTIDDPETAAFVDVALAEVQAELDQLAARVPLVCSDDRHEAKVRGLEAERNRLRTKVTQLERDLSDAYDEITEQMNHNDETCSAVAARDAAEAEVERLRAIVRRIDQMANYWEQHLPEVIRTPAVVSALRATTERAALDGPAAGGVIPAGALTHVGEGPACDGILTPASVAALDVPTTLEEPDFPSQRPGGPVYETQLGPADQQPTEAEDRAFHDMVAITEDLGLYEPPTGPAGGQQ